MTGRERITAAFEHRPTDAVPFFEQAFASDVASALLGREAFTGTTMLHYQEAVAWSRGDEAHAEFEQRLFGDLLDLADLLGFDMLPIPWRRPERPTRRLNEYEFLYGDPEGDHELWRYDPNAKTYFRAARCAALPEPEDPNELEPLVERAERAAERATVPTIPADDWRLRLRAARPALEVIGIGWLAIPLQPIWLMACQLRPDLVARHLEAQLHTSCLTAEAWAALGFRVAWGGGDLADNHGPIYGPRIFRELVLPRVQRYTARLHELGCWYVYRTDGNLWPIADEFFHQAGIDGYGEIDYDAGMSILDLQPRYGERVTFNGDVPCGSLLHRGRPAEIREFVLRRREAFAASGGWILGSSNSIVPGTPPDNVLAMLQAARE